MPKLYMTMGLPGSGKSTIALEMVRKQPNLREFSRDEIRLTLSEDADIHKYKQNKTNEKKVTEVLNEAVVNSLTDGFDVIIHDTNLNPKYVTPWEEVCEYLNVDIEFINTFELFKLENTDYVHEFFALNAYVKLCKQRNLKRYESVPESVIDQMADKWYYSKIVKPEQYEILPEAIIVDIDGTLAEKGERNPYDETQVLYDTTHDEVIRSVLHEQEHGRKIIVVSGRHDTCKEDTILWLRKHGINFDELHMRKEDDNRGDDVVKYEIYMEHIQSRYNIKKVFDDRDRVVFMWRRLLGLRTYQVQEGNF